MCITRHNTGWGIPVPGDDTKVIYVWFDALINYLSATGWPEGDWESLWPADVHWMAKEIFTRFHATLWPAVLMAADLPLPKTVIAHGWFTFSGEKISKSKGGLITPQGLADEIVAASQCDPEIAIDVVRYSLAAFLPYEGDKDFSVEEVERRYNSDLANDLGNALNRSLAMSHKFAGGVVPDAPIEAEVEAAIANAKRDYEAALEDFRWDQAVDIAIDLIRFLNKYIDTRAPWALAKSGDPSLPSVLRSMLFALRTAEGLLRPIMPVASDEIARQLGVDPLRDFAAIGEIATLPAGATLATPKPIFPRIEMKPESKSKPEHVAKTEPKPEPKPEPPAAPEVAELIGIEEFARMQLRIGRVLEAEPLEGSDRLLKLQVIIGEERRQIVAGIRASYAPLDLVGRQVVVVVNLKPVKLRGVESQGMLLAATDDEGKAILLQPDRETPEGAKVK
mgnify:CR=1 FL=1